MPVIVVEPFPDLTVVGLDDLFCWPGVVDYYYKPPILYFSLNVLKRAKAASLWSS